MARYEGFSNPTIQPGLNSKRCADAARSADAAARPRRDTLMAAASFNYQWNNANLIMSAPLYTRG